MGSGFPYWRCLQKFFFTEGNEGNKGQTEMRDP